MSSRTSGIACGIILVSACTTAPPPDRDSLYSHAQSSPVTAVRDLRTLHEFHGLPIFHWSDTTLNDSLAAAGEEMGPCGYQPMVWTKRLTPVRRGFSLDRVLEFDDARVIREWPFPANAMPIGIRGDALLYRAVWASRDVAIDSTAIPVLELRPDGSIRVEAARGALSFGTHIGCPSHASDTTSAYWTCAEYVDLASRAKRKLAYEGTCS